ncbi:cystathionine beta-lyase [Acetobacter sp. LMG 1636]|uniref:Cystathionine beta-lyase n=2 Tax=Acetobacter fallax TaxID=1737473 RepID=A0ABX0K855_9PROT|nr:cystathionine beta-lyase [Acetobacter fallax]NHO36213.1 cystathionine beta-lyase [Acetobacter fallax]
MRVAIMMMVGTVSPSPAATLDRATTNYLTHCGGCHGIEGISGRTFVPELRNHVGVFACSEEGRHYLARVPGVSMSLIRNDQELADVLNLVLFRMGGESTPLGTKPYSVQEIHELRRQPVATTDIMTLRIAVIQRARALCLKSTEKNVSGG